MILQIKFKRNGEITRIQWPLECKAGGSIVHDFVIVTCLSSFDSRLLLSIAVCVVLMMIIPVTALFFSFDSELKGCGIEYCFCADVDLAKNFLSRIIKWLVSLDVEIASVELGSSVDISHTYNI